MARATTFSGQKKMCVCVQFMIIYIYIDYVYEMYCVCVCVPIWIFICIPYMCMYLFIYTHIYIESILMYRRIRYVETHFLLLKVPHLQRRWTTCWLSCWPLGSLHWGYWIWMNGIGEIQVPSHKAVPPSYKLVYNPHYLIRYILHKA